MLQGIGGEMPALGLGTGGLLGESARRAIQEAIDVGYRHFDTAEWYKNEKEVGDGIRRARIDRDSVFIVTKVWYNHLDRKGIKKALAGSLKRLQTDYINLLLIHWPNMNVPLAETLEAMYELHVGGKISHIGLSNFPWLC